MLRCLTALLILAVAISSTASVITTDPNLPPNVGGYVSPTQVHACYPNCASIDLTNVLHSFFFNVIRIPVGPNELETFNSTATGMVSVGGGSFNPVTLDGPVQTTVFGKVGNTIGTFATEMTAMNLVGAGVTIRESPTLQSTGQTTITDNGGGTYRIDSFFDIFTELSIDGGQSWIPSIGSTHVDLVDFPEPAAWLLCCTGLLAVMRAKSRKTIPPDYGGIITSSPEVGQKETSAICRHPFERSFP